MDSRSDSVNVAIAWYVHHFRVTSAEELDDEMLGWLRESYRMMGEQRRFVDK